MGTWIIPLNVLEPEPVVEIETVIEIVVEPVVERAVEPVVKLDVSPLLKPFDLKLFCVLEVSQSVLLGCKVTELQLQLWQERSAKGQLSCLLDNTTPPSHSHGHGS